ncbi:hypothetical protein SAMN04488543_0192 [Friedmanniella luteola]|uniref:Uncharacterized protein n=1 Tax=Friedmanniella luteola TaxID=546871 RepID=A0A1H1LD34_9ACTN|nr:hypothetical protein [Friedmanniella luteola]SDR71935.1 hypothetical protein SAMN04488543_0192 [Friedmanniella luteola]
MSYAHVHLHDPTGQPLVGPSSLVTSQAAARTYALQQAVAELRNRPRTPRPARVPLWGRVRRIASRPAPRLTARP